MSETARYVGARYVPKFYENSLDPTSTLWEPNVTYEPLTIVSLPNSHSYISKKAVPDIIGSPALNAEYWLDNGYESAYIHELEELVEELSDKIGELDDLTTTDKDSVVDAINEVNEKLNNKVVVFGNSFAQGVNDVFGIYYRIEDMFDDSLLYVASGASFLPYTNNGNNTYAKLLSDAPADNDVTDIVILGAVGEQRSMQEYSTTGWITAMQNATSLFASNAKSKYPNLKSIKYINCSAMPHLHDSTSRTASGYSDYQTEFWVHLLLNKALRGSGITYLGWAGWDILLDPSYFQADNVHPTQEGSDIIANNVRNLINGGIPVYNEKRFTQSVTCQATPDYTATGCVIVHRVLPDYTIQAQQGSNNVGGTQVFSANETWDFIDPNNMNFMPPIGNYASSGGVFDTGNKVQNVISQATHGNDSWVNESLLYKDGKRTPTWQRATGSGTTIYNTRLRRIPCQIMIIHDPLDTSGYL